MKKPANLLLLLPLFFLNLFQAGFTFLFSDEAYYYTWAEIPDWAYFDHPPGVALGIGAGLVIFGDNILGVRIIFVLAQLLALWIFLYKIAPDNTKTRLLAAFSIPLVHAYGWLATPDGLLLLGAALYWWVYQRFLKENSIRYAVLLGLTMALMLWSKYHGIVVILLTLASNPGLAKNRNAWLAVFTGFLAFAPHLYWQYAQGFPTLQYHFSARSPEPYVFRHSVEFVVNQFLLYQPVLFAFVFSYCFRHRQNDLFAKAMQYNMLGFPFFFLLLTGNNYSEPHWTYMIVFPLIYFAPAVYANVQRKKALRLFVFVWIGLLVLARISLMVTPEKWPLTEHLYRADVKAAQAAAAGLPLVIANSYQETALADFYTGQKCYGILAANRQSRHNQYTAIGDQLAGLQGKPAYIVSEFQFYESKRIDIPGHPNRWLWGKRTEALDFPNRIHIKVIGNNLPAHHSYSLEIMNPYPQPIVLGGAQYHLLASLFSQGWQKDFKFVEMPITTLPPEANMVIADLKLPFADLDFPQKTVLFSIAGKEEPFPCNSVFYGLPD